MLYKTILALTKKICNKIWRYAFLGIQGRAKCHKVKYIKIFFYFFLWRI